MEPSTVYRDTREAGGTVVHCDSAIRSWEGWPDDVRETIQRWNRARRLRFVYTRLTFKCPDCRRFISAVGSTACQLDHKLVCDDCVIERVRRYGRRGRPETDLEKTRRRLRDLQRRVARYRHNAIQERVFVGLLLVRIDAILERAEDSLTGERRDDPVPGLPDAVDALQEARAILSKHIEKARRVVDDHRDGT